MERLRFLGSTNIITIPEIIFENVTVNEVATQRVTFNNSVVPMNLSGFQLVNAKGKVVNDDCKGFNYLYRNMIADNGTYTLTTNSEDEYVAPPEPEPVPEPTPYVPTLEEVKSSKISMMSSTAQTMIYAGITMDINGEPEAFSYNAEDQSNIDNLFEAVIGTDNSIYYHSNSNFCKEYSADQTLVLWAKEKINKNYHTTYFNMMREYIRSFTSDEDRETIGNINYGDTLTGIYAETMNAACTQNSAAMLAMLVKRSGKTQEELLTLLGINADGTPSDAE